MRTRHQQIRPLCVHSYMRVVNVSKQGVILREPPEHPIRRSLSQWSRISSSGPSSNVVGLGWVLGFFWVGLGWVASPGFSAGLRLGTTPYDTYVVPYLARTTARQLKTGFPPSCTVKREERSQTMRDSFEVSGHEFRCIRAISCAPYSDDIYRVTIRQPILQPIHPLPPTAPPSCPPRPPPPSPPSPLPSSPP